MLTFISCIIVSWNVWDELFLLSNRYETFLFRTSAIFIFFKVHNWTVSSYKLLKKYSLDQKFWKVVFKEAINETADNK